jgi:hypothetical protein
LSVLGQGVNGHGDGQDEHDVGGVADLDAVVVADAEPLLAGLSDRVAVAFDLVISYSWSTKLP